LLQVKYALPGMAGSLIELACNEDLDNMWDEWDEYIASSSSGNARLQLYVDAAAGSAHSSGSSSGGHRQLQPQTPNSASNAVLGNAAAGVAASALAQLAAGQSCSWDGSAADADVLVPVYSSGGGQAQQQAAQPLQLLGLHSAAVTDAAGGNNTAAAAAAADDYEEGSSSEQFATCYDMTAALESDPEVAAVLAAIAAEKAAGKPGTGEVQSDSRQSQQQQQQQQGSTELKQLVKQLQVRLCGRRYV
jgi:hypothetical protein